ncbi:hypothetical protein ACEQ8H_007614 [Pleosporales sp. CAS-2024a]
MADLEATQARFALSIGERRTTAWIIAQAELIRVNLRRKLRKYTSALQHCKRRSRPVLELKIRELVTSTIDAEAMSIRWRNVYRDKYKQCLVDSYAYASADCRSLCMMMHAKLPRELRDLVYGHMAKSQMVLVEPSPSAADRARCNNNEQLMGMQILPAFQFSKTDSVYRHLFWSEFTTGPVMVEWVEAWFREATFLILNPNNIKHLVQPLAFIPELEVSKFVRHVTIEIPEMHIRPATWVVKRVRQNRRNFLRFETVAGRLLHLPDCLSRTVKAHLQLCAQLLISITPTVDLSYDQKFRGRVNPWHKHASSFGCLRNGMQFLWPAIEELSARGYKISLALDDKAHCILTKDNTAWTPDACLAATVRWSRENWQKGTQTAS